MEGDGLLYERVRAHHQVDRPVGDALEDALSVLAGDRARQQGVRERVLGGVGVGLEVQQARLRGRPRGPGAGDLEVGPRADRLQERLHRTQVLAGEDLGRRHDGRLVPGVDGDERRVHGHEGLARPHVALQQDVHRARPGHGLVDRRHRPRLRDGRRERDRRVQPPRERAAGGVRDARPLGLDAVLAERHAELEREQFVELQPFDRRGELPVVLGEVDASDRLVVVRESLVAGELGRHRIGDRR